jgi:membrane protease YdiL (CAAX protease family)
VAKPSTVRMSGAAVGLTYSLMCIAMATTWHLDIPTGLWLANAVAALLGITSGLWALRPQLSQLFRGWRRDFLPGIYVAIALVALSQLGARLLLLQLPFAREELLRLYTLLHSPPGPTQASPILLFVVIAEELVFRGVLTTFLEQRLKPTLVTLVGTSLYTLPLFASGSWLLPIVGFTLGAAWTIARQRSNGLTIPLLSHAVFSLTTFVWLPVC